MSDKPKIASEAEIVDAEQNNRPKIVVIDATDDSAYRHPCGAMVTPRFDGTGLAPRCPLCGLTT